MSALNFARDVFTVVLLLLVAIGVLDIVCTVVSTGWPVDRIVSHPVLAALLLLVAVAVVGDVVRTVRVS